MLSKDVLIYIKLVEEIQEKYNIYLLNILNSQGIEALIKTISSKKKGKKN